MSEIVTSPSAYDLTVEQLRELHRQPQICPARLLCDDHVGLPWPAAITERDGQTSELTYLQLKNSSERLAGSLVELGVGSGDHVGVMLPKSAELLITILALFRIGAVHVPLFTALGADALRHRLDTCNAQAVVVSDLNRERLPESGRPTICVGIPAQGGDQVFEELVARGRPHPAAFVSPDDPLVLMFTSGTTGKPKGVQIPVWSLASFHAYMTLCLGLRSDDVFLNISDPGWGYGLFYGVIGPLLVGHTTLLRDVRFDPDDLVAALQRYGVTNLCGSPTAFRALSKARPSPEDFPPHLVQRISSAGEPLTADVAEWARTVMGTPILDHYGQSELGMVVGIPHGTEDLGLAGPTDVLGPSLPGFRAVVLDPQGHELPPGSAGELALDTSASPLFWFHGYLDDEAATAARFPHGHRYYTTADRATVVAPGVFAAASRADDVITSSGYRIGPFDIEAAVGSDSAVNQSAAIGVPDPLRGEAVAVVVVLAPGSTPSLALSDRLGNAVRARVGKHATLRHVFYSPQLPMTPSGKVQRSLLRHLASTQPEAIGIDIPPT